MKEAIIGGVVSGLLVLIIAGAWSRRGWLQTWWARLMNSVDELDEEAEWEQLVVLREQVLERARKLGLKLPVSQSGEKVTYSNGETFTFIADHGIYRARMNSGRADLLRTYNKTPPTPLNHRDRAWLQKWLDDNPLDENT